MNIPKIKQLVAREVLDSRGIPTVAVTLILENGLTATSTAATSSQKGKHRAQEIRDNDPNRYLGLGVQQVVNTINQTIAPKLTGLDPTQQGKVDATLIELDGSKQKKNLGVNAVLPISQATAIAGAKIYNLPVYKYLQLKYQLASDTPNIPTPAFNLINGGKLGSGNLDFQEFLLVPSSRLPFQKSLQVGVEIFYTLEQELINNNAIHSTGVEGGFAPNLFTNLDALEIIMMAIKNTNYQYGHDLFMALDVAANTIQKSGKYTIKDRAQAFTTKDFIEYYLELNEQYHLLFLEDPLHENDWQGWQELSKELSQKVLIVADDLIANDKKRLKKAIDSHAAQSLIVKLNQFGTLTETIDIIHQAKEAKWSIIVSSVTGDSNDQFLADFSVGIGAEYVKFGAPNRGERVAKYNRLKEIEEHLIQQTTPTQTSTS